MLILNTPHALATYRAYRATALWFAGQLESGALTCSGGTTIQATTAEETWDTSLDWLKKLCEPSFAHIAEAQCCMTGCAENTIVPRADMRDKCICPKCTLREMHARRNIAQEQR